MDGFLKVLILPIFLGLSTHLCGQHTRYFTNLAGIISPYLDYQPRCEIEKQRAQNSHHYQVDYLNDGKISEIRYYKRGLPDEGAYYGTHMVKINYSKGRIERSYFDTNQKPKNLWRHYFEGGDIQKEVFELNEDGNKASLRLFDKDGNRVSTTSGIYSMQWKEVEAHSFIQHQYDKDGNKLPLTSYFQMTSVRISTDALGYLETIENLNPNTLEPEMNSKIGYAKVIFDFDEYGNELGWKFTNEKGSLTNRKKLEGTDYGYASWVYNVDWTDRSLGLHSGFTEVYFDDSGSRIANNYGIYLVECEKNKFGDYTSIRFFDAKNQLMVSPVDGYASLIIEYDQNGELLSRNLYDENGNELDKG